MRRLFEDVLILVVVIFWLTALLMVAGNEFFPLYVWLWGHQ